MPVPLLVWGGIAAGSFLVYEVSSYFKKKEDSKIARAKADEAVQQARAEEARQAPYYAAAQSKSPVDDLALIFREWKIPIIVGASVVGIVMIVGAIASRK